MSIIFLPETIDWIIQQIIIQIVTDYTNPTFSIFSNEREGLALQCSPPPLNALLDREIFFKIKVDQNFLWNSIGPDDSSNISMLNIKREKKYFSVEHELKYVRRLRHNKNEIINFF